MKIKELEAKVAAKAFELGFCLPMEMCVAIGDEVMVVLKRLGEKLANGVDEKVVFSEYVEYVKSCYSTDGKTAMSKGHLKLVELGFYTQEETDAIANDVEELEQYWNETAKPTIMETVALMAA